jgi:hypothetical protein
MHDNLIALPVNYDGIPGTELTTEQTVREFVFHPILNYPA